MPHEFYENPLIERYASRKMARLWGAQKKFSTWRQLWVWLAESEAELGLPISQAQIAELKAHIDDIDFEAAAAHEARLRHDVMAHVHTYGDICPTAKPIVHLGATSCFVTDNADLMLLRAGLELIQQRLLKVIFNLADFAQQHRSLACLGFTHMQPAQPTTIGRRACLWAYDLVLDLQEIDHRLHALRARSTKGTTGTQASFLELFGGDHLRVRKLEHLVARKMGFEDTYAVTGQTYSRKVDTQVLEALSGIAGSAHKAATDIRLLAHRKEVEEPFGKDQIGSSAMAYKRNPMLCERICGLARFAMSLPASAAATHATQWMERTLDDSANRRLTLPQSFLALDALLMIYAKVTADMVVYPQVIRKHLMEELPFMATENILMAAVTAGGDRQDLHERIRQHSQAAAAVVKGEGGSNDLLARLATDDAFQGIDLEAALDPAGLVGRAPEQVDEFLAEVIEPLRSQVRKVDAAEGEIRV
jgi:adenylosuccinate lyase